MSTDRTEADEVLDVRDVDGEPFGPIIAALDGLGEDESLLLIAPFEPVPLYDVLEGRGFAYETDRGESDIWYVSIESA
jgi:uncharacterized protein (DUF2249 family)